MFVSVYCKDADGSAAPREAKLAEHLQYIETILGKLKAAGPVVGPGGDTQAGSLLVLEVDGVEEAETIMRSDPYYQAGVWREVNIQEYKIVAGSWVGGKTW